MKNTVESSEKEIFKDIRPDCPRCEKASKQAFMLVIFNLECKLEALPYNVVNNSGYHNVY